MSTSINERTYVDNGLSVESINKIVERSVMTFECQIRNTIKVLLLRRFLTQIRIFNIMPYYFLHTYVYQ